MPRGHFEINCTLKILVLKCGKIILIEMRQNYFLILALSFLMTSWLLYFLIFVYSLFLPIFIFICFYFVCFTRFGFKIKEPNGKRRRKLRLNKALGVLFWAATIVLITMLIILTILVIICMKTLVAPLSVPAVVMKVTAIILTLGITLRAPMWVC